MNATIKKAIRDDDFLDDPFGTAMSHHFGIADALTVSNLPVPASWHYRPAMGLSRSVVADDWPGADYLYLIGEREVTVEELHHAGNVLARYVAMLDRYGRTY